MLPEVPPPPTNPFSVTVSHLKYLGIKRVAKISTESHVLRSPSIPGKLRQMVTLPQTCRLPLLCGTFFSGSLVLIIQFSNQYIFSGRPPLTTCTIIGNINQYGYYIFSH